MTDCAVIIPTKNRLESLIRAILSLYNQINLPKQIIIVDDNSKVEVTLAILPQPPNEIEILIFRTDRSMGAPFCRNKGVELCSCEVAIFLDDDDVFHANKIEKVSRVFDNSSVDLVTSYARVSIQQYNLKYLIKPHECPVFRKQLQKNLIGTTSMMCVRRNLFVNIGGFDELLPARQDYEFGLRLLMHRIEVVCIPNILVDINVEFSEESISKSVNKNVEALEYINNKYSHELAQLTYSENQMRDLANNNFLAHKMIISGDLNSAIVTLLKGAVKYRSLSSLVAGLSLCLGRRIFFKLLSIRNR